MDFEHIFLNLKVLGFSDITIGNILMIFYTLVKKVPFISTG